MKRPVAIWIILGLICLCLPNSLAMAKYRWDPIEASDWQISGESREDITDAAMLSEKVFMDHRNPKLVQHTIHCRIRILSEAGRKWGDVTVPTLHADQRVSRIEGRTLLPNGDEFHLEKDQIFKKTVFETKGTELEKTSFSLPGITDDCIVEYRIEYQIPELGGTLWHVQKDIYLHEGEFKWCFFRGRGVSDKAWRKGYVPNWHVRPKTLNVNIEILPSADNPKEIRTRVKNVPPFEPEPYGLPAASLKSRLAYYYSSGDDKGAYWKMLAKDRAKGLKTFCRKNKRVRKTVAPFSALEGREDKIKAAYDWLQKNIENRGSALKGDKGSHKKNRYADDVLKRGYGTPEDINTVFHEMLKQMNITSNMAFAVDRARAMFDSDAKYWQFNSSLVVVPPGRTGGVTVFSPGSKYLPAGSVPWQNEGIPAFLIGDPDHLFITLRLSDSGANRTHRVVDLNLSSDLQVSGKGKEEHTGHIGHKLRLQGHWGGETVGSDEILKQLSQVYYDAELDSMTYQQMEDPDSPVVLAYTITFSGQEEAMGSRLLLQPAKYLERAINPFRTDRRKTPVMLPYASQTDEVLTITLPDGWEVEALPAEQSFRNKAGFCMATFSAEGNTLSVKRVFRVERAYFTDKDYPSIRELHQFLQGLDDLSFVLRAHEK